MKVSTLILSNGSLWINVPLVEEKFEKFREDLINELEKEEIPVVAEMEKKEGISFFEVFTGLDQEEIELLSNRLVRKEVENAHDRVLNRAEFAQ